MNKNIGINVITDITHAVKEKSKQALISAGNKSLSVGNRILRKNVPDFMSRAGTALIVLVFQLKRKHIYFEDKSADTLHPLSPYSDMGVTRKIFLELYAKGERPTYDAYQSERCSEIENILDRKYEIRRREREVKKRYAYIA